MRKKCWKLQQIFLSVLQSLAIASTVPVPELWLQQQTEIAQFIHNCTCIKPQPLFAQKDQAMTVSLMHKPSKAFKTASFSCVWSWRAAWRRGVSVSNSILLSDYSDVFNSLLLYYTWCLSSRKKEMSSYHQYNNKSLSEECSDFDSDSGHTTSGSLDLIQGLMSHRTQSLI